MKKIYIFIFCCVFTLTGCNFYTYYLQTGSTAFPETKPESIAFYSGDIDKEYQVIGSVAVDVVMDGVAAKNYLRLKASKLGADAIIYVKLVKLNSFTQRTGISGVAVKFN